MRDIHARPSRAGDITELDDALRSTDNCFDPEILQYSHNIRFLTAARGKDAIAHIPVQSVLMLESLGINPTASENDLARALNELIRYVLTLMHEGNFNEMYFIGTDARVCKVAENHGFKVLLDDTAKGHKLFVIKARWF